MGIILVDIHLKWLNWFYFLILQALMALSQELADLF